MAISPPSDIVLDVARAVDAGELEAAKARLAQRAGGAGSSDGSAAFSVAESEAPVRPMLTRAAETPQNDPFQRFEAMVLQTFLQSMLPDNTDSVYGKGMAGEMWKSLMAEELAKSMAARGGIGIADRMLRDHYRDGENTVPAGPLSGGPEKAETDRQAMLSSALLDQMQMRLARTLDDDRAATVDTN